MSEVSRDAIEAWHQAQPCGPHGGKCPLVACWVPNDFTGFPVDPPDCPWARATTREQVDRIVFEVTAEHEHPAYFRGIRVDYHLEHRPRLIWGAVDGAADFDEPVAG